MNTAVLTATTSYSVNADTSDGLWLDEADVTAATGWEMKPEGFCQGDVCVPTPADRDTYLRDGKVNIKAFWDLMGKPVASSADGSAWSLGDSASDCTARLDSLTAPDFTLPDVDGKPVSLSDFRRKRVLLITWASW